MFLSILKFCNVETESPKSYSVFRKRIDKDIDKNIEDMKTGTGKIIWENNSYIVLEKSPIETSTINSEMMEKKQNILLGVPIKKSIAYVSTMLIISIISLVLKISLIESEALHYNLLSVGLCLALIITFLFYFIGDLHDIIVGKGIFIDGKMYFSNRTKFKDILFRIGDILKFVILLGSIYITVTLLLNLKDEVLAINILGMWLIYFIVGYISRIRLQRSYIYLLLVGVFLITFSFW